MCFCMSCAQKKEAIQSRFDAELVGGYDYEPYYFTAAGSFPQVPIVSDAEPRAIQPMEWSLIPHWAQSEEKALQIRKFTYNARDDSIFDKPSFRDAILRNRCLVIADGWFEWHQRAGRKYPYYIQLSDGQPFAMAGIWSEWKLGGLAKRTFSIVTTEANPMMAEIHNSKKRMPVILPQEKERTWLDRTLPRPEIAKLMRPCDERLMKAHTVSKLVSTPGADKDVPEAIAPFEYPELASAASQTTLF